jgi:penicillin-binding protein 1A
MKRFFNIALWSLSVVLLLGLCTGATAWYTFSSNLPSVGSLKEYRPPIITEVFSEDGEVLGRFSEEKRVVVPLTQIPEHLTHAFIAAEDARFLEHQGIDFMSVIRAFFKNLLAGRIEQGGSTITQQVAKSLILKNTKRTYQRKAREAILAMEIEKNFSKDQVIFLYLNHIYLGHGAYGVEAAAQTYFNKHAIDLNLAESALLAGLPQAPSRYSPVSHFERAKSRQKYVLERMREERYISDQEAEDAFRVPLNIQVAQENAFVKAPYFTEYVRRYIIEKYGRELLYRGGLKVHTTLNLKMQRAAQRALSKGLSELDKREGYRGAIRHLTDDEIARYKGGRAAEKSWVSPPEVGSIVEALVEKVDNVKKETVVLIGEELGRLPLAQMKWARKPNPKVAYYHTALNKPLNALKPGDLILVRLVKKASKPFAWEVSLEQSKEVQGALFCMEPESGKVRAMVGGQDFALSQFNRAKQSRRQPGSSFKPIIYAAALDYGLTPGDVLMDSPYISDQNHESEVWKPKNYKRKFFGPTLFRTALIKSRNVITVKILEKIGLRYAIDYARKMGIESSLSGDLSFLVHRKYR